MTLTFSILPTVNSPKPTDVYHFAFSKYAAMISSRVSGLSADTCDFCDDVDFWLVAPKLILLLDKLGAADNVLELDRLSSTDRIFELIFKFSKTAKFN